MQIIDQACIPVTGRAEYHSLHRILLQEEAWSKKPLQLLSDEPDIIDPGFAALHNQFFSLVHGISCYAIENATIFGNFVAQEDNAFVSKDVTPDHRYAQICTDVEALDAHERRLPVRELSSPVVQFFTPDYKIYGHWLIEMIPKIWIMEEIAREHGIHARYVVPSDTPHFAISIMKDLFNLQDDKFFIFNRDEEALHCPVVYVPTLAQVNTQFHPYANEIYSGLKSRVVQTQPQGSRLLFLSRRNARLTSRSYARRLINEDEIEEALIRSGFEVVYPEALSFSDQIALFSQARVLIGEYGSALHNSVFAASGACVIGFGMINIAQSGVCALRDQRVAYLKEADRIQRSPISWDYTVDPEKVKRLVESSLAATERAA